MPKTGVITHPGLEDQSKGGRQSSVLEDQTKGGRQSRILEHE